MGKTITPITAMVPPTEPKIKVATLLTTAPGPPSAISCDNSCWSIIIYFKNLKIRNIKKIKDELIKNNFFPRPFFYPLTSIPAYKKINKKFKKFKTQNPIAYKTHAKGLVLPSSYILTKSQIKKISKIIIKNVF